MAPYAHLRGRTTHVNSASRGDAVHSTTGVVGLIDVLDLVQRVSGGAVDADAPLMEAGVDSLGAVELRTQLQKLAGESATLPSTIVFDHPTARALVSIVSPAPTPARVIVFTGTLSAKDSMVTITSSRETLPRGVVRIWGIEANAYNTVTEVPNSRWDPVGIGGWWGGHAGPIQNGAP